MALPSQITKSIQNQGANLLKTGQRFSRFDQVRQRHFWSKYRFSPNADGYIESGSYEFFQTQVGQQGQGFPFQLTLLETNWMGANRVPDNQNLIITEFGITCNLVAEVGLEDHPFSILDSSSFAANSAQLLANAHLDVTYLTNSVSLGMLNDFAQASGPQLGYYAPSMPQVYPLPTGPSTVSGADAFRGYVTNGLAAPSLRRKMKIPILLQHGETFNMTIVVDAGRGPFMTPPEADYSYATDPLTFAFDVRLEFWATESFVNKS